MRTEPVDESLFVRYLLGNLSESEEVQVEDRAFADASYLGALEAAEADLIDAYVSGELPPAERRAFESRFLLSPGRRSKVEFAKALARVTRESKADEFLASKRPAGWRLLVRMFREWNPALQFAAAAAVLVAVAGGTWLAVENSAMRSRVANLESQRRDFEVREEGLRRQLAEAQKQPGSGTPTATPTPAIASLVLLPGVSRSEAGRRELVLQPPTQLARIEIQLESRDAVYRHYRAELRASGGEEVLIHGKLLGQRSSSGYAVSLDVPASAMNTGPYELTLKGVSADRPAEEIGYYYFRVRK